MTNEYNKWSAPNEFPKHQKVERKDETNSIIGHSVLSGQRLFDLLKYVRFNRFHLINQSGSKFQVLMEKWDS